MDTQPQKLPARALACGCEGCRQHMRDDFARIILADYEDDELLDLLEISRIGFGRQTIGERIDAYTLKEARF